MEKALKQDQMESLIRQLNSMSLNDPNYGLIYYQAVKMDPNVAAVVQSPSTRTILTQGSHNNYSIPSGTREEMQCYGCREKGHGLGTCPQIIDALNKGTVS